MGPSQTIMWSELVTCKVLRLSGLSKLFKYHLLLSFSFCSPTCQTRKFHGLGVF